MTEHIRCPHCGDELPVNAPSGVCPKCLLKAGVGNDSAITLDGLPLQEGPGDRISQYELLELVGEGGMGLVYLAEQKKPVKRRVALKIIKPGMDSKQVIARFEAERQALAVLDHPNIAHVFDAGTTKTGRPYFVMEYVKGMSITRYCDGNKLNIEQRLKLFERVCEGIHHAHQKGIIHRDIKPSNVLVSLHGDRLVPKIIDFGVAKAVTQSLTEGTFVTLQGQLLGTPEYMSPEQVDQATQDIDIRSDIYSLGIVLYELMAGVLPFERSSLANLGFAEVQRTIREQEPDSPSLRLTRLGNEANSIAASRGTQVLALARRLHRELEWIPLKAMRKDRCRRYRSASEMADDIRNYLDGLPLLAGPETAIYQVRKFVRRHAGSVATVMLVSIAITLGLVVSIVMGCRADRAREREAVARTQAEQARDKEATLRAKVEQALIRAEEAEKLADDQRRLAEQQAEEYRRSLYAHQITLANVAHQDRDMRRLRELLDSCPIDLRGWEWDRLNYMSDQAVITLSGDKERVYDLSFAPDGKRFISAGRDGIIRMWNASDGTELMTLHGHKETVRSAIFSPDGKRIASVSSDKTIKIWDAQSGVELKTLVVEDGLFNPNRGPIAFSPDSKKIISGGKNNSIKIWDADKGIEIKILNGHKAWLYCFAFTADGKRIVSGSRDKTLRIWDVESGKELMVLEGHKSGIGDIAISPDGKHIVSVSADKTARLWDIETGNSLMTLDSHGGMLGSVAFSPDGKRIVTGGESGRIGGSGTIKVWDAITGSELITLLGHLSRVTCVAFSLDGKHIVSGSLDGKIKFWNPEVDITAPVTLEGRHGSMTFSRDGKHFVTSGKDNIIRVWDVVTQDELMKIEEAGGSVSLSPDGTRIISADGNDINVWDVSDGKKLMTLSGHDKSIWALSYSPDGTRIASGGLDKTVRIWNADTGAEIRTLRGHSDSPFMADFISPVTSVTFSPDGKLVASGSYDYTVKLWEVETGAEVMTMDKHSSLISDVTFSPDGKLFASASSDRTIRVCDVQTGDEILILKGHNIEALSVAFSPDGKRIVSGSKDETIRIWDAKTGNEVERLSIGGSVWDIAFSPDGNTLATASERVRRTGYTITLWKSAASGGPRGTMAVEQLTK